MLRKARANYDIKVCDHHALETCIHLLVTNSTLYHETPTGSVFLGDSPYQLEKTLGDTWL